MLTRKEIAQRWRISVDTLRKRFEADPQYPKPALKLSRKTVLWEEAEIERYGQRLTTRLVG